MRSSTVTSLAPLARVTPKATIGWSNRRVKVRGSAAPSTTVPSSSSRTLRPPGSAIGSAARSATLRAPARVRIACSWPASSPRPPPRSTLSARTCSLTAAAVTPSASSFCGIERDADLAVDAAEALHFADAVDALQVARDRVVDEPRQLLDRHAGRGGGVGDDRQPLDVDPADDRLVDGARQVAADLGDLVLHVVERPVDVDRADVELDDGGGRAVGDRRDDVPDAVEAGDRVLDLLRHLRFRARPARRPTG